MYIVFKILVFQNFPKNAHFKKLFKLLPTLPMQVIQYYVAYPTFFEFFKIVHSNLFKLFQI